MAKDGMRLAMEDLNPMALLLVCLVILNVITFLVYGLDKWKAVRHRRRISERTLLGLAFFGGSLGAWLGMKVWHHKTLHRKFRLGIPLMMILQLLFFYFAF